MLYQRCTFTILEVVSPASYFRLTTLDRPLEESVFDFLLRSIVAVEPTVAISSALHILSRNPDFWNGTFLWIVDWTTLLCSSPRLGPDRSLSTVIPYSYSIRLG